MQRWNVRAGRWRGLEACLLLPAPTATACAWGSDRGANSAVLLSVSLSPPHPSRTPSKGSIKSRRRKSHRDPRQLRSAVLAAPLPFTWAAGER